MELNDFESTRDVRSTNELETFLARRFVVDHLRVNSFWMSHKDRYPCMSMLVNEDLARLDFMVSDDDAGYCSRGPAANLQPDGTTVLYLRRAPQAVPNRTIITVNDAVRAAKEFFASKGLPNAIAWTKL